MRQVLRKGLKDIVVDEVPELLLRGKRGVEDRVRYGNSIHDLTPIDHIEARLTLGLKPVMKTQRIIRKADGRRAAAHGFHGA